MERMELADFLLIAEIHSGISAHDLARMDRVVALASSALAAPFASYGGHEPYPTLSEKAAIYLSRVARNHALPDGNKRTAYDVMVEFVERNGHTYTHPAGQWERTADMIEKLSAGTLSEGTLIAILRLHISPA